MSCSIGGLFLEVVGTMTQGLTLEDQIVVAIRRIIRAIDLHSRHLTEQVGLTGPQLMALKAAAEREHASVGALAKAIHLSSPTLTGILDRLERRGLIHRVPDAQDRRSLVVTVTQAGRDVLALAPSLLQDRFRKELAQLVDWEQTMILATLQRIAAMMEAQDIEATPLLDAGSIESGLPGSAHRSLAAQGQSKPGGVRSGHRSE